MKGIIFDFNGVIVDDYVLQKAAWNQMSQKLRQKPVTDDEMVANIRGVPTRDIIKWLTSSALPLEQVEELAKEKEQTIRQLYF